jgi:hypothetical protein
MLRKHENSAPQKTSRTGTIQTVAVVAMVLAFAAFPLLGPRTTIAAAGAVGALVIVGWVLR